MLLNCLLAAAVGSTQQHYSQRAEAKKWWTTEKITAIMCYRGRLWLCFRGRGYLDRR
jgi:hypothetical protein